LLVKPEAPYLWNLYKTRRSHPPPQRFPLYSTRAFPAMHQRITWWWWWKDDECVEKRMDWTGRVWTLGASHASIMSKVKRRNSLSFKKSELSLSLWSAL